MNVIMEANLKISKIINFFSQLEKKEIISQSKLAKNVLISLGMANAILKKAISKGYVKVKAAPYKRYVYYLTKKGFSEKSNLVQEYLEDSLNFFKQAKRSYIEIFKKLKNKKIYIVGKGDLVDVSKLAAIEINVKLAGHLIINEKKKLKVISGKLEKHNKTVVYVMVESKIPQAIYDDLKKIVKSNSIFHPKILHISDFEAN